MNTLDNTGKKDIITDYIKDGTVKNVIEDYVSGKKGGEEKKEGGEEKKEEKKEGKGDEKKGDGKEEKKEEKKL